jgi:hypothetical protein
LRRHGTVQGLLGSLADEAGRREIGEAADRSAVEMSEDEGLDGDIIEGAAYYQRYQELLPEAVRDLPQPKNDRQIWYERRLDELADRFSSQH